MKIFRPVMLLPLLLIGCAESSIVEKSSQSKPFIAGEMKIIRTCFGDAKCEYYGLPFFNLSAGVDNPNLVAQAEKDAMDSCGADALVNEGVEVEWVCENYWVYAQVVHVTAIGVKLGSD